MEHLQIQFYASSSSREKGDSAKMILWFA